MKQELNLNDLNEVSGGRYHINVDNKKLMFDYIDGVFQLKNCTAYQAADACDSLKGKFKTEEEYDNACLDLLRSKGWL